MAEREAPSTPHYEGRPWEAARAEPEGLALTSGKAPSAKTISSDVFPQPPSPTRTTLTDGAPGGASSLAAWAAFIAAGRGAAGGDGAGLARGRPGGAGMWKGRRGGRKWEPGGRGAGRRPR